MQLYRKKNINGLSYLSLRMKQDKKNFKEMTESSTLLSSGFDTKDDIEEQSKRFLMELNKMLHQCFTNICFREFTNKEVDKLFDRQRALKKKEDKNSKSWLTGWPKICIKL